MNNSCDSGVLSGIRVVDMGRFIAGPYCATLLADLGADVIRVERPGGGEDRYVVPVAPSGEGGSFLQTGRNKRSVCLNLSTDCGKEALLALIAKADVLVANLPAAQLRKIGVDYDTLSVLYPALIVTTASAYGETGPLAGKTGFDGIGQAMSGAAFLSGTPGAPTRWAATYVDFGTAIACAFGTLAAIRHRDKTGLGQHVQGSLLRTALTFFNSNLIETNASGQNRTPSGNRGQQMAPSDIFSTRDGHVLIQVLGDDQFHRLAKLLERNDWIGNPSLRGDAARGENADLICEVLGLWTATRSCEEVLAAMTNARITAEQVLSPLQALAHPHMTEAALFQHMSYPSMPGTAPIVAPQVELSRSPATYRSRAPTPGEHTNEILAELGYNAAQIEQASRIS